jgi:hypothetical protein
MSGRERRRAGRKAASLDVRYRTVGHSVVDPAHNVSATGIFLGCEEPLPLGTLVELTLDDGDPLSLEAKVVRVVWGGRRDGEPVEPGMALEFISLDDDAKSRLERLLEDV